MLASHVLLMAVNKLVGFPQYQGRCVRLNIIYMQPAADKLTCRCNRRSCFAVAVAKCMPSQENQACMARDNSTSWWCTAASRRCALLAASTSVTCALPPQNSMVTVVMSEAVV